MLADGPCLDHQWRPKSQIAFDELWLSLSLHQISKCNSVDNKLHIPTRGLPCPHHSLVACNQSKAWKFPAPNHAQPTPACQTRSIHPPRGFLILVLPRDISESHLPNDKPGKNLKVEGFRKFSSKKRINRRINKQAAVRNNSMATCQHVILLFFVEFSVQVKLKKMGQNKSTLWFAW